MRIRDFTFSMKYAIEKNSIPEIFTVSFCLKDEICFTKLLQLRFFYDPICKGFKLLESFKVRGFFEKRK